MAYDPERLKRALDPPAGYYDVRDTTAVAVAMAHRALRSHVGPQLIEAGLHPGQDLVILEVARLGGRGTPTEVAAGLGLTRQSLSTVLRRLEGAGYLRRRRDPGDGRVVRVEVTKQGQASAFSAAAVWREAEETLDSVLSAGSREWLRCLAREARAAWLEGSQGDWKP